MRRTNHLDHVRRANAGDARGEVNPMSNRMTRDFDDLAKTIYGVAMLILFVVILLIVLL